MALSHNVVYVSVPFQVVSNGHSQVFGRSMLLLGVCGHVAYCLYTLYWISLISDGQNVALVGVEFHLPQCLSVSHSS